MNGGKGKWGAGGGAEFSSPSIVELPETENVPFNPLVTCKMSCPQQGPALCRMNAGSNKRIRKWKNDWQRPHSSLHCTDHSNKRKDKMA